MSQITARFTGTLGAFGLNAALDIPATGITGLFGPSGSGKTTLLRCLAGLTRLSGATLSVGGEIWQSETVFLPPYQRALGYVFQDARLFPHLTVRGNLRFGLKRAKGPPAIAEDDVIDFLGLTPLLNRAPTALSGGERQRVAIGRALLTQPRLLLLDEPLSALDHETAAEILPRLRALSARFGVPALFVSHQLDELERVAGHLLLMQAGRITASGPLTKLLTDLSLPFAAREKAATALELTITGYDDAYGLTLCGTAPLVVSIPGQWGQPGQCLRLRIPASDVSLARTPTPSSILNQLPARILQAQALEGPHMLVALDLGEAKLLARITRKSWDMLALAPGQEVYAAIKAEALMAAQ
jgi:molybdate transport system ATP-binding protein